MGEEEWHLIRFRINVKRRNYVLRVYLQAGWRKICSFSLAAETARLLQLGSNFAKTDQYNSNHIQVAVTELQKLPDSAP